MANFKLLKGWLSLFCQSWRRFLGLVAPLILLPLVFATDRNEAKGAYVCLLMAIYWMLELLPLAVTALMPVVFLPLFGVADTDTISRLYMKDTIMLFVGGLTLAVAVEHCNLHKRIALKVLLLVGKDVHWLMMGFMLTTMFLSMWISNTATTAMMVPIIDAVISQLEESRKANSIPLTEINASKEDKIDVSDNDKEDKLANHASLQVVTSEIPDKENKQEFDRIKFALLLSIAYSANVGGTGSLTGTGPNLVFKGLIERNYPKSSEITFASWMMYNVPGMVLCVILAWVFVAFIIMRYKKSSASDNKAIRNTIEREYEKLGKITFHETAVFILFLTLVFLWVFRDPKFIPGWTSLFDETVEIDDATPAIGIAILFFLIPARPSEFGKSPPLLDWKTAQSKLPWGIVLLIGGGFALAEGAKRSGLSKWMGNQLTVLEFMSAEGIIILLCIFTAMITEVFSNTATANIVLPVVNELALALKVNPIYMTLPVVICCSYAFMLPVATPPNAIVFEAGNMHIKRMVPPGLAMNVLCCLIQFAMITTIGRAMFNLGTFPAWAEEETIGGIGNFTANITDTS